MQTLSEPVGPTFHAWFHDDHQELSTTLQNSLAGTGIHPPRWLAHFKDNLFAATLALTIYKAILSLQDKSASRIKISKIINSIQNDLALFTAYEKYLLAVQKALKYSQQLVENPDSISNILSYFEEVNAYQNLAIAFGLTKIQIQLEERKNSLQEKLSLLERSRPNSSAGRNTNDLTSIPLKTDYLGSAEKYHPYLIEYFQAIAPQASALDFAQAAYMVLSGAGLQTARTFFIDFGIEKNTEYVSSYLFHSLDVDTSDLPPYFFKSASGLIIDTNPMTEEQKYSYDIIQNRFSSSEVRDIFSLYLQSGVNSVAKKYPSTAFHQNTDK